MTDQSPNAQLHAASFLDGANADYVDQLQARYATDPNSVDAAWAEFFRALGDSELDAKRAAAGPSWARADWPLLPADDLTAALTGEWAAPPPAREAKAAGEKIVAKAAEAGVTLSNDQIQRAVLDSIRALMIIRAYRIRGHLAADLDPLGMTDRGNHPELDPASYGFTEADMDRPIFIDNVLGLTHASMREIIDILKRTYCGTFALQYMHISDPESTAISPITITPEHNNMAWAIASEKGCRICWGSWVTWPESLGEKWMPTALNRESIRTAIAAEPMTAPTWRFAL